MVKALFILAIGVAIGYAYGYKDARTHDKSVVERALDRAKGTARAYTTDIDQPTDTSTAGR